VVAGRLSERLTGAKGRRRDPDDWPASQDQDRPRVLIEYPSAGTPTVLAEVLSRVGYESAICERPADRPQSCRLLRTGECALAAGADVIFNGFGLANAEHRQIISELRATYPETPMVVETTRLRAEANADLLEGCTRCDSALTSQVLVEAVQEAEAKAAPEVGAE
jgi:hypothetical protein